MAFAPLSPDPLVILLGVPEVPDTIMITVRLGGFPSCSTPPAYTIDTN